MQPNVVWVVLDSVRADHTTMQGYHRETTPRLQSIAEEGLSFSRCFCHGHKTSSSTASILTGVHPVHHGVGVSGERTLPDDLRTVPELLSEAGYRTACLSRNPHVSSAHGLDRGFDRFAWLRSSSLLDVAGPTLTARYLRNVRRHSAGLVRDTGKHSTAYLLTEVAKRWLDSLGDDEPFFCYLHYNETHTPFYPPVPYFDAFSEDLDLEGRELAERGYELLHTDHQDYIGPDGFTFSEREWELIRALYDAELAYADDRIGHLFEFLRSLDLDETVFVVTSDHGELLGERGLFGHNFVLDDALIHVPLVVHGLDGIADQRDEIVQHVDVLRTLLGEAGARTEQLQGVDLRSESRAHAVAQRGEMEMGFYPEGFGDGWLHEPVLSAIRDDDHKYVESEAGSELYDLESEGTDVSAERPEVADGLAAKLTAELDRREWIVGEPVEYSDEMRDRLVDLGYRPG